MSVEFASFYDLKKKLDLGTVPTVWGFCISLYYYIILFILSRKKKDKENYPLKNPLENVCFTVTLFHLTLTYR